MSARAGLVDYESSEESEPETISGYAEKKLSTEAPAVAVASDACIEVESEAAVAPVGLTVAFPPSVPAPQDFIPTDPFAEEVPRKRRRRGEFLGEMDASELKQQALLDPDWQVTPGERKVVGNTGTDLLWNRKFLKTDVDLANSRSRRKHQISWLAADVRDNLDELQARASRETMLRDQSRAKYGW
ncbi:MAG: uncharacterized protein KVP18_001272 [Porospora cf. gigantea A]|uniref:uncharacterized protein n=1 Tax=Porospora cf. gigantea A TaxID=2853593 RepID=UPI00355A3E88|nr:MAG: hypothetical protein KVP18_001272 [Porospora cf. gigantea A]